MHAKLYEINFQKLCTANVSFLLEYTKTMNQQHCLLDSNIIINDSIVSTDLIDMQHPNLASFCPMMTTNRVFGSNRAAISVIIC